MTKKDLKKNIKTIINKGGRMLQRKPKDEKMSVGDSLPKRPFAKLRKKMPKQKWLKKIKENIQEKRNKKNSIDGGEIKVLKVWDKKFQGSFDRTIRHTAKMIKKYKKKTKNSASDK